MKVEDLKNTKIYLYDKEDRIKFQKKVFKLGVKWSEGDQSAVDNTNGDMFFTIDNYLHLFLDWGKTYFINNTSKQIFLEDVLAIEEPKEECNFKPFDKVLVRDSDDDVWVPRFYSNRRRESKSYPFAVTSGGAYKQCIPYEGNEQFVETTKSKD